MTRTDSVDCPPTGIDTLRLMAPYTIHGSAPRLDVRRHRSDEGKDVVLWREGEREVRGTMALFNGGDFHLRIAPPRPARGMKRSWGDPIARISFSVPRVATGTNMPIATQDQFRQAINSVQERLRAEGVDVNLWEAKIVRMDISRNFSLRQPLKEYFPVYEQWHMLREHHYHLYKTGFVSRNGTHQVGLYDKKVEVEAHARKEGENADLALQRANLILGEDPIGRVEWRLVKSSAVATYTDFATTMDLWRDYGSLGHRLDAFLHQHLLRDDEAARRIANAPRASQEISIRRHAAKHFALSVSTLVALHGSHPPEAFMSSYPEYLAFLGHRQCERELGYKMMSRFLLNTFKGIYGKKGRDKYTELRKRLRLQSLQRYVWCNGGFKSGAQLYLELRDALLYVIDTAPSQKEQAGPGPELADAAMDTWQDDVEKQIA